MGSVEAISVRDYPRYTSETTDEARINRALKAAANTGGGTVYFPAGIYIIASQILLPSKVRMLGEGGTTFGAGSLDIGTALPENFITQAVTVIKLDDGSDSNMLELEDTSNYILQNSCIENFVFWGNRSQNEGNGIYLNNSAIDQRGHNKFINILIYDMNGTGFYIGLGHQELHMDNVIAYNCTYDGFDIRAGEDSKLYKIQSAKNGESGIRITQEGSHGGALRFYDTDVWENGMGIEIFDVMNIFFFGVSANNNQYSGIYIYRSNWAPSQIHITRGTFDSNSHNNLTSPGSDIFIESTAIDVPHAIFVDKCLFRGSSDTSKPNYPIQDMATTPARNIVTNCCYISSNYRYPKLVNIDTYSCSQNYDLSTSECVDEYNLPYRYMTDTVIKNSDVYLTVNSSAGNIALTLPSINSVQLGKVFFISKTTNDTNTISVNPIGTDGFTGNSTINNQYGTLMVVRAGTNWYSIKIS